MHYDAVIIGAGMSGLAAGIRLAYYDKRVCVLEKHYAYGGLNSYYRLGGRDFDVGLHAVTNYCPPERRSAPLSKLLRQLRLSREDFDLRPQRFSEIRFPGCTLRFTNDFTLLENEVAQKFPRAVDAFRRFVSDLKAYDDTALDRPFRAARPVLGESLADPALIEMLLCPIMYYGSASEHDMDFAQFVTMFKSLFLEGFARPPGGVRRIVTALVKKFRSVGGELRMRTGVSRLEVHDGSVREVVLETGERLTAEVILSSAGFVETMTLCGSEAGVVSDDETGRVSFVESIAVLDSPPTAFGHEATIVFYNEADRFSYAAPAELVDTRSGVVCCPNNYEGHEHLTEGLLRVTWLANPIAWRRLDESSYRSKKRVCRERFLELAGTYLPGAGDHVICTDMFTPLTIERFTGHRNGAVYGSPRKRRDGRTPLKNLFICGTDQGFLGIVGAMLSGITIANLHVLSEG